MTDSEERRDGARPEVGSLGEEASKLLGALTGWARDHGAGVGHSLSDAAEHAAGTAHEVDEHLATGSAECAVCPLCRAVHAVRGLSPEVRSHLTTAVSSLAQAANALLSTQPPGAGGDERAPRADVDGDDLDEVPADEPQ